MKSRLGESKQLSGIVLRKKKSCFAKDISENGLKADLISQTRREWFNGKFEAPHRALKPQLFYALCRRLCAEVSSRNLGSKDELSCSRCAGVKPCQRRGFQFLFSERQIPFLSPVLCTLITKIRVFHVEKVILQMLEVCTIWYALHVNHVLFIPAFYEPSPIFLTCLEVLLWGTLRHSGWGGLRHVIHPKEARRIMKVGLSNCPSGPCFFRV